MNIYKGEVCAKGNALVPKARFFALRPLSVVVRFVGSVIKTDKNQ
jgi:hypothetical protein